MTAHVNHGFEVFSALAVPTVVRRMRHRKRLVREVVLNAATIRCANAPAATTVHSGRDPTAVNRFRRPSASTSDVALTAAARIEPTDSDRELRTFSINAQSAESRLGASPGRMPLPAWAHYRR